MRHPVSTRGWVKEVLGPPGRPKGEFPFGGTARSAKGAK